MKQVVDFDSDGQDLFLCVAGRRVARRLGGRWVVVAEGWQVTGSLRSPTIVRPGGEVVALASAPTAGIPSL
jgi:hypothetical protein